MSIFCTPICVELISRYRKKIAGFLCSPKVHTHRELLLRCYQEVRIRSGTAISLKTDPIN